MFHSVHHLLRDVFAPPPPPPALVSLRGQFDAVPHMAHVGALRFYGRAVRKHHAGHPPTPPAPPQARMAFYELYSMQPEPPRTVWIENQFGRQPMLLGRPVGLLVPAQQHPGPPAPPPPPPPAPWPPFPYDHYKVYDVLQHPPIHTQVMLDEMGPTPPIPAEVRQARFFAVPVEKRHGDRVSPIREPRLHLTCYDVMAPWPPLQEAYHDQFVPHVPVHTGAPRLLLVPSAKVGWAPLDRGLLDLTEDPVKFVTLEYRVVGGDHHILDAHNLHASKPIEAKVDWNWHDGATGKTTASSRTLRIEPGKSTNYEFQYSAHKDSRISDYRVVSATFV